MEKEELQRERKYCSRLGLSLCFVMLWMIVWGFLVAFVDIALGDYRMSDTAYYLLQDAHYLLSLPLSFFVCRKIPFTPPTVQPVSLARIARWFLMGCAMMSVGSIIGSMVNDAVFYLIDKPPVDFLEEALDSCPYIVILLSVCVFGPIAEELTFRRLLAGRLSRYGQAPAAFVSALVFALFHTNLGQFFYAFALGLLFAYAYFRTGRFWVPCLLHIIANLYGSAIPMLLPDTDLALGLYGILILALDITGLLLLFRHIRHMTWEHGEYPPRIRVIFLNLGMILLVLLCFVMTTVNFLFA